MSGLKREDEYRLKELTQLVEEKGRVNLNEDQLLMLQLLEDRYNRFLDEGLRKLRQAANPQSPRQSFRALFSSGRGSPKMNATPTSESIDGNVLDLNSGSSPLAAPPQASGKLWTWILDYLVVGAVPYANQTSDTPGHLCELNEQCFQRKCRIAAVVSCIDVEEPFPPGFAAAKDWETQLSVNTFFHVACIPNGEGEVGQLTADQIAMDLSPLGPTHRIRPNDDEQGGGGGGGGGGASEDTEEEQPPLIDTVEVVSSPTTAGTPSLSKGDDGGLTAPDDGVAVDITPLPSNPAFEEIIAVCQNISKLMEPEGSASSSKKRLSIVGSKQDRRKVVYVHCKAGLSRSWVFSMCFLMYHFHKSYDESDQYLRSLRAFMPKPCHVAFVRSFAAYISTPKFAAVSDEEEKYIRLLAEVLSMSPKYRQKLLQDLEKLT
ncbi:dual specificity protein phosphatase, putative [Bodo saltans]|uniref:Dual specificity protein phosphatase, putative n=1 Tax=Bodo saltans TaxID=75058 RepID=A0A0S4JCH1_BODSA|nr:dual specificity protein phosphatase, putative [Bodo saltans]|eukprot:CUG88069.1 dual specificity protein phosphatase, putative [Bodo saltans]